MTEKELTEWLQNTGYPVTSAGLAKIIYSFVLAERERCAKIAEDFRDEGGDTMTYRTALSQNIAETIRQS